jgi:transposase InsO family protein
LKPVVDPPQRDRWARLRFSIIGPLLAAPPPEGELQAALKSLAAKSWRHPLADREICFGVSTLERWYYAAKSASDPVAALRNRLRDDVGRFPSLSPRAIEVLEAQYREHPGWTMQLHVDNLRVALAGSALPVPSYPTIRRYLTAHGMFRQARPKRATDGALLARERIERLEVRSFEVDHVSALWHLDFHHASRKVLGRAGNWIKPLLLGVIDDRSRLVCHLQWYLFETAESLVHGLSQAFMKRGLPRALMTDNGAAMLADETVTGLAGLGIVHQTTLPYSPYQNAKQESFWGRVEGRLMAMLEGEASITLDLLNQATQAWVEQEYHRTLHSEIGTTPLARYLAGPNVRRDCPPAAELAAAFRIEVVRRQRRSDGTVSLAGARFEIPAAYRHLVQVHLRYARWDLTRVDLVDARASHILSPLRPLDKSANADGQRRALLPAASRVTDGVPRPPSGMAPLLRQLIAEYAATGLPPAYLPTTDKDCA